MATRCRQAKISSFVYSASVLKNHDEQESEVCEKKPAWIQREAITGLSHEDEKLHRDQVDEDQKNPENPGILCGQGGERWRAVCRVLFWSR